LLPVAADPAVAHSAPRTPEPGEDREYASVPIMDKWLVTMVIGAVVMYEAVTLFIGLAPHELFASWRRGRRAHALKHHGDFR
jgi:hypothetical protein